MFTFFTDDECSTMPPPHSLARSALPILILKPAGQWQRLHHLLEEAQNVLMLSQWRHLVMVFLSFASCSQLTFVLGTDTDDFWGSGMLSIRSKIAVIFWSESLTCTKGSPPDTLNLKRKKKPKPTNNWLNSYAKTHQFFI